MAEFIMIQKGKYTNHFLFGKDREGMDCIIAFCVTEGEFVNVAVYPFRTTHLVSHIACTNSPTEVEGIFHLFTTNNMSKGLAKEIWEDLVNAGFHRLADVSLCKFDITIAPMKEYFVKEDQSNDEDYDYCKTTTSYALEA
jgi:hypothetical protein